MKLCSYVVMIDSGFAPNPFWRYCTLAACTPNHMRLGLEPGDWILGNRSDHEHRLIYAMQVDERLCLDCYYQNPRFVRKRPSNTGATTRPDQERR